MKKNHNTSEEKEIIKTSRREVKWKLSQSQPRIQIYLSLSRISTCMTRPHICTYIHSSCTSYMLLAPSWCIPLCIPTALPLGPLNTPSQRAYRALPVSSLCVQRPLMHYCNHTTGCVLLYSDRSSLPRSGNHFTQQTTNNEHWNKQPTAHFAYTIPMSYAYSLCLQPMLIA